MQWSVARPEAVGPKVRPRPKSISFIILRNYSSLHWYLDPWPSYNLYKNRPFSTQFVINGATGAASFACVSFVYNSNSGFALLTLNWIGDEIGNAPILTSILSETIKKTSVSTQKTHSESLENRLQTCWDLGIFPLTIQSGFLNTRAFEKSDLALSCGAVARSFAHQWHQAKSAYSTCFIVEAQVRAVWIRPNEFVWRSPWPAWADNRRRNV